MSKLLEGTLGSFTSVVAGSDQNIEALTGVRAHVSGTFVADIDLEISYDEGASYALFQQLTAPGLSNEFPPAGILRANCTAFTSGTAVVNFGGRDDNRKA